MCVPIHTHIHLMNKKINMKNARRGPGISLNGKDTFILCQIVILIPQVCFRGPLGANAHPGGTRWEFRQPSPCKPSGRCGLGIWLPLWPCPAPGCPEHVGSEQVDGISPPPASQQQIVILYKGPSVPRDFSRTEN